MNDIPKFIFNCTDCGKCCERDVTICLNDIKEWMDHGMMYMVIPYLSIVGEYSSITIQLDKVDQDDKKVCALYDTEKKKCKVETCKPVSCRSYPLGYDGTNYLIIDKQCPGLGHGKMTAESLNTMREYAREDHNNKTNTNLILPMLEALFIKRMTIQSQKAMEELTPQQRDELENILKS